MHKGRLEAFNDGVIALIITIMVLEMKVPHGEEWSAIMPLIPVFVSYVLSFVNVGIYWNNHHHMLQAAKHVDGRVLWANLHLLFWLSLMPFVTGWMGENHFAPIPVALYGFDLVMCGSGSSRSSATRRSSPSRIVPDVARAAHRAGDAVVGHQPLELLAGVLAALIGVMQQSIRLAASPDRHDERVGDQLRRHAGAHRPADDAPREEVDDGRHIEPALGRPDVGEVGDPLLVRPLRRELAIEKVRRQGGQRADRLRPSAARAGEDEPAKPEPASGVRSCAGRRRCLRASTSRQTRRAP